MDLTLNNQQRLICYKNQPTNNQTCFSHFSLDISMYIKAYILPVSTLKDAVNYTGIYVHICNAY